jgi:hypothetical protein
MQRHTADATRNAMRKLRSLILVLLAATLVSAACVSPVRAAMRRAGNARRANRAKTRRCRRTYPTPGALSSAQLEASQGRNGAGSGSSQQQDTDWPAPAGPAALFPARPELTSVFGAQAEPAFAGPARFLLYCSLLL